MSNCITCGQGIPHNIKETIQRYQDKGVVRYAYRLKNTGWRLVDKESFREIHKKYNKRKERNGYEYYHISEFKGY